MNMDRSQTVTRVRVRIEDSNEGIERTSEDLDMVMACFSYTKYYLNLFQCLTEDWIYINAA